MKKKLSDTESTHTRRIHDKSFWENGDFLIKKQVISNKKITCLD
jgi:hypothetical protein